MNGVLPNEQEERSNIVVSWTGGKDGCYSCYRALMDGYQVTHLLNFRNISKSGSHDINPDVLRAQADAIGIPIVQRGFDSYERAFGEVVRELRAQGVRFDGAAFGHIATHGALVDRVCTDLGLVPILPLWGRDSREVIAEIVETGFEIVIVGVRDGILDREWLGHRIDDSFIDDLAALDPAIDPCGENGEFHTVVTDGPLFSRRIVITRSEPVHLDDHWLLKVLAFDLETKE